MSLEHTEWAVMDLTICKRYNNIDFKYTHSESLTLLICLDWTFPSDYDFWVITSILILGWLGRVYPTTTAKESTLWWLSPGRRWYSWFYGHMYNWNRITTSQTRPGNDWSKALGISKNYTKNKNTKCPVHKHIWQLQKATQIVLSFIHTNESSLSLLQ